MTPAASAPAKALPVVWPASVIAGPVLKFSRVRYALLIYERPGAYDGLTDDDRRAITGEYVALRDDPRVVDGERLAPAATASTVRRQDGRMLVSDGPFADTKEVFGGYYLVDADDVEAAQAIAARIPATRMGGSVEVRALVEPAR